MKKIFLIFSLLSSLFLYGCALNLNNDVSNQSEKNKECVGLESKIRIQMYNIRDDLIAFSDSWGETKRAIDQIFYSKKYDSCIYSVNVYAVSSDISDDFEVRFYNYSTREFLGTSNTCTGYDKPGAIVECSHKLSEYNALLLEYKQ